MIKYIQHKDIDKQKWDNCISNSFNKLFYAYSWYLDVVSPNWDALITEDYLEVMPLTHRRKYGIHYIYQPIICQQLGVFSTINKTAFSVDDFIEAIPDKFKLIDISFNTKNIISKLQIGDNVTDGINYELMLSRPYRELYKNYARNHKKNLEKIQSSDFIIDTGKELIETFYKYKTGIIEQKKIRFSKKDKDTFYCEMNTFKDKTQVYLIKNKFNEMLGGICFIHFENRVISQSFTTEVGRNFAIGYYLFDMFFKKYAEQNIFFDFMGSNIKSIAYRNEGFGSIKTIYHRVSINKLPKILNKIKSVIDILK